MSVRLEGAELNLLNAVSKLGCIDFPDSSASLKRQAAVDEVIKQMSTMQISGTVNASQALSGAVASAATATATAAASTHVFAMSDDGQKSSHEEKNKAALAEIDRYIKSVEAFIDVELTDPSLKKFKPVLKHIFALLLNPLERPQFEKFLKDGGLDKFSLVQWQILLLLFVDYYDFLNISLFKSLLNKFCELPFNQKDPAIKSTTIQDIKKDVLDNVVYRFVHHEINIKKEDTAIEFLELMRTNTAFPVDCTVADFLSVRQAIANNNPYTPPFMAVEGRKLCQYIYNHLDEFEKKRCLNMIAPGFILGEFFLKMSTSGELILAQNADQTFLKDIFTWALYTHVDVLKWNILPATKRDFSDALGFQRWCEEFYRNWDTKLAVEFANIQLNYWVTGNGEGGSSLRTYILNLSKNLERWVTQMNPHWKKAKYFIPDTIVSNLNLLVSTIDLATSQGKRPYDAIQEVFDPSLQVKSSFAVEARAAANLFARSQANFSMPASSPVSAPTTAVVGTSAGLPAVAKPQK